MEEVQKKQAISLSEVKEILGKVDVEEILGSIFNDFCIGK